MQLQKTFAVLTALFAVLWLGCGAPAAPTTPPPAASATTTASDAGAKTFPETAAEAEALRTKGASWTNVEIREHYLRLIGKVKSGDEKAKAEGVKAEERAKRAYTIRHDARMTCRAMMSDRREVEGLHERDQKKYGHADGPTFEQLVEHEKTKGLTGDAVYDAIVASSQRTDGAVNDLLGVKPGT